MSLINKIKDFNLKEEIEKLKELIQTFYQNYKDTNSEKIRLIYTFIVFSGIVLILQLIYMLTNGLDPMNSLIAGLISCLGTITLLVCLRLHVNPKTKLPENSTEQVYAEFFVASLILFFVCINFVG